MKRRPFSRLIFAAFVAGLSVLATGQTTAQTQPATPARPAPSSSALSKGNGQTATTAAADDASKKLVDQFKDQRETMLSERRKLMEKYEKAGTDEERRKILEQLKQQQQTRVDEQRELARLIRDQMRQQREKRPGT